MCSCGTVVEFMLRVSMRVGGADCVRRCESMLPGRCGSTEASGDVVLGLLLGRLGEQHFGLAELDQLAEVPERDRARDAQALLLAAGEAERALLQLVLDLAPQRALGQRLLDTHVHLALR